MRRALKYAALAAAALIFSAAAVVAYLILTFDPRDYQPRIVEYVQEKTGRTLHIEGDTRLSFWPDLGVRMGPLWLSERASDERFAEIESALLRVKMRPLLSGELIADEVRIEGAHIRITRFADGRLNIDDFFEDKGGDSTLDIGHLAVRRSALTFRDMQSGKQYELSAIDLETGRIAHAVTTDIALSLKARDAAPTFDLAALLKARLMSDASKRTYRLNDASVELKGTALDVSDLTARLNIGAFVANLNEPTFNATAVMAAVDGVALGENIKTRWSTENIAVASDRADATNVAVDADVTGAAGKTHVQLKLPQLMRAGERINADAAATDLHVERGGLALRAALTSSIQGSLGDRTLALTQIKSQLTASGSRLPAKGIRGTLNGSAAFDLEKEGVQLALAGTVAESRVKAHLTSTGFASPLYNFAVDVDQLDLDRFAAARPGKRDASAAGLDLSPLSEILANGTISIGMLKSAEVKARNVKFVLTP